MQRRLQVALPYEWRKNGSLVTSGVSNTNGALSIPSADVSDAGTYTLQVSYAGVSGETASVTLSVGTPIKWGFTRTEHSCLWPPVKPVWK